ncbi:5-(carboxyamino)imidazole ribonucleotide synthase [Sphingomonas changbaiensis NBRC 104936]|uniref:N5-carboxyaminoimidazole ribonucleotide synthase n=1 Tax=Sphingomonas changbaiensis NBRC 104936 TaxID=1219043 RepID=A0A0E9MQJ4_9SPHN|nr:5-(carboxyamino)imidazole ribonucleotide synthase [Sphingomonas changbaiensis]GAO39768.1 5-(carboxyamino)imidazole ribonucleotide synthase [Sphingomonas changbaiensis NBRC 104936]
MILPPGSTIGILGGGQLGRMLAMAAAQLGYRSHIYAPEASGPATEVSAEWTKAGYDDADALARFAESVGVVTYEFENVPPAALDRLEALVPIRPGKRSLEISRVREREKTLVRDLGGRTAPFRAVGSLAQLRDAFAEIGAPSILKTSSLGYDGKGQVRLRDGSELEQAWEAVRGALCVLEGFVTFDAEFSVLLCRAESGETAVWDTPENVHTHGILDTSTTPARTLILDQAERAIALAHKIADELDHIGLLTCEFFATADGPVFNEMAPRVHNSGHWTIEGAVTSQFENHIRAVCGLPLGSTTRTGARVEMKNLIGEDANDWPEILRDPAAKLHLYGKHVRPGRKMGHVTRLF